MHERVRRAARLTRSCTRLARGAGAGTAAVAMLAVGCVPGGEETRAPGSRTAAGANGIPATERATIAGAIAFVSERGSGRDLYLVRVRDGAERRLTSVWGDEFPGAVAPDGRSVAVVWAANPPGEHVEQIAVFSLAGTGGARPRVVTPRSARVRGPSWSPDGRWLAFEADMHSFRDVYRVSAAGGPPRRLTRSPEGNFEPAVSPDGRAIAFVSSRDGTSQIYRMRADGGDERRLTAFYRDDWGPSWSPDGAQIAFVSQREGVDRVFVMRADGTGQRRLTTEAPLTAQPAAAQPAAASPDIVEGEPAWSPDGQRLALVRRARAGGARIQVAQVRSAQATTLPCPSDVCDAPAWSPDGRYLTFVSTAGGNPDVYVSRSDGTGPTRLTTSPAADWLPRWVAGEWPGGSR